MGNSVLIRDTIASCIYRPTQDRKEPEHTQRVPPGLMVVTIRARANRIDVLRPLVPEIFRVLERLKPGMFVQVGT